MRYAWLILVALAVSGCKKKEAEAPMADPGPRLELELGEAMWAESEGKSQLKLSITATNTREEVTWIATNVSVGADACNGRAGLGKAVAKGASQTHAFAIDCAKEALGVSRGASVPVKGTIVYETAKGQQNWTFEDSVAIAAAQAPSSDQEVRREGTDEKSADDQGVSR